MKNHNIKPRNPKFNFSKTPRHWVELDAFTTHVYNSVHLLAPELEYWFCRLINKILNDITDEELISDLRNFVKQEAQHGRTHESAKFYFERYGIDVSEITRDQKSFFRVYLSDYPLGQKISKYISRPWLGFRLAMIAAIEHYFCFLGSWLLLTESLDNKADSEMLKLLRWHGAEEVEHRTVGFDAFNAYMSNHHHLAYPIRQTAMAVVTPWVVISILTTTKKVLALDNSPESQRFAKMSLLELLGEYIKRANMDERLPPISLLLKAMLSWLDPKHHPKNFGDLESALCYLNGSTSLNKQVYETI